MMEKGGGSRQARAGEMGWLRLGGPLKTWVSNAKEPYTRDYILQQRPNFKGAY